MTASARRCAVLGDPIAHSLSPVLHRAGYAALGIDWTYDAVRVPGGQLPDFLDGLGPEWRGLSLTMPLKREVLPLADRVSAGAARAGAANTLIFDGDGARTAENTDVPGAVAAIRERYAGPLGRTAIWGGGATAASALLAAAELGCREFSLLVRDPARATETLAAADRFEAELSVRVSALGGPVDADLLVSTIPAAATVPLLASIHRAEVVFDVGYDPWPSPLARWADDSGSVLVGGLDLLIHQAAAQFELFTERAAPLEVLRRAGERALAARTSGG